MKIRDLLAPIATSLALLPSIAVTADHSDKMVGQIQASWAGGDCFFFTLVGVTDADLSVRAGPWFAIARTQYGAKDALATLLAAKVSGLTVLVSTNGTPSCGYATASSVTLQ